MQFYCFSAIISVVVVKAGKEPGPLKVLEQVETLVTVLSQLLNSSLFTMALHVLRLYRTNNDDNNSNNDNNNNNNNGIGIGQIKPPIGICV